MPLSDAERQRELELKHKVAVARAKAQAQSQEPVYSPIQQQVSDAFGIPPSQVDPSRGIPTGQRFQIGQAANTPEEQMAYLRTRYPHGVVKNVEGNIVAHPGQKGDRPLFANPEGTEWGSLAEFAGSAAAPTLGSMAGSVAGIPGAMAGAAGGELLQELAQKRLGTSRETAPEVLTRAGLSGAMEMLPLAGRGGKALWRKVTGKGRDLFGLLRGSSPADLDSLLSTLSQREGITFPELMLYQKSNDPVMKQISAQARQFSKKAQDRLVKQLNDLGDLAKSMKGNTDSADEIVQRLYGQQYGAVRGKIAPSYEEGGEAYQNIVEGVLGSRKKTMRGAYDLLDDFADANPSIYDISGSITAAQKRKVMGLGLPEEVEGKIVDASGKPMTTETVQDLVNVAQPQEKLARINSLISKLSPKQTNYRVLKELRSQVGNLLDNSSARNMEGGVDIAQAKALYRQLSEDMVKGQPDEFKRLSFDATGKAKVYYDTYDLEPVSSILRSVDRKNPIQAFDQMKMNPVQHPEEFIKVLDEAQKSSPQAVAALRTNLEKGILGADDPVAAFRLWKEKNPRALNWIYPEAYQRRNALANAKRLKELASGVYSEAHDAASTRVGFALDALKKYSERRFVPGENVSQQAAKLAESLGPDGTEAFKTAALGDAIDKMLKEHATTGRLTINPTATSKQIERLKGLGVWDGIFSDRERDFLTAAEKYSRKTWKLGESGTGLAVASQIGQLRSGDPHQLFNLVHSRVLADMITRTSIPFSSFFSPAPKTAGVLGSSVARGIFTGLRQGLLQEGLKEEPEVRHISTPNAL